MNVQSARAALEAAFDHPNADGDVCRKARDELLVLEQEVTLLRAQVEALGLELQKAREEALGEAARVARDEASRARKVRQAVDGTTLAARRAYQDAEAIEDTAGRIEDDILRLKS